MTSGEIREVVAQIKREEKILNDKLTDIIIQRLLELGAIGGTKNGWAVLIKYKGTTRNMPMAVWVEGGDILKGAFVWHDYPMSSDEDKCTRTTCRIANQNFFKHKKFIALELAKRKQTFVFLEAVNIE